MKESCDRILLIACVCGVVVGISGCGGERGGQSGNPEGAAPAAGIGARFLDEAGLSASQSALVMDKGRQAANALVQNLLNAQLKSAMDAGGPENAIQVCQQVAQPMTESTAKAFEGVSIRRTSLKVRNPANAPDAIDRKVLLAWQAVHDAGEKLPEEDIVRDGDGAARYYKPIAVQALCLNCHGERASLKPDVIAMLDRYYPQDNAYGYMEGDFRGVVRVDVAIPPGG